MFSLLAFVYQSFLLKDLFRFNKLLKTSGTEKGHVELGVKDPYHMEGTEIHFDKHANFDCMLTLIANYAVLWLRRDFRTASDP